MDKNKVISSIVAVLCVLFPILLFIVLCLVGTPTTNTSLIIMYIFITLCHVYITSDVVGLLYKFYEMPKPWQRFIPFVNELYIIDMKYRRIAWCALIMTIFFILLANLPFQIKSILGGNFIASGGFYCYLIALFAFFISQIFVSIGVFNTINEIAVEWERLAGCTLGFVGLFKIFSIIPIVRIYSLYSLRKPLDTLVTFNNKTITSSNQVRIIEEEEE